LTCYQLLYHLIGAVQQKARCFDGKKIQQEYSGVSKQAQSQTREQIGWDQPRHGDCQPGLVTVTQDKRFFIKLDRKRLQRLKESAST
jgi:hypothetical protein